jgi:hypothetical protein
MGKYVKTICAVFPLLFEWWRALVGLFIGEVLALLIASLRIWNPESKGASLLEALPGWAYAVAFLVFLIVAQFMVLHSMRVQRDDLKKLTDYEGALGALGGLYDEGTAILNFAVTTDQELIAWETNWDRWRQAVENTIGGSFGPAERALFHSSVLFKDHRLPGHNAIHSNRRSQLAHKLELLRAFMIRHSDKASQWRKEADAG